MDERNQSFIKPKTRGPLQEVILPDFSDDDNTVTTTLTKSRRVSFGTNFIKEFIVGSAVSTQFVSEYEQNFSSSDSSNPNSSLSAVENEILDGDKSTHEKLKIYQPTATDPEEDIENRSKPGKFGSTICFSADSPTTDMEFTEGCLSLARNILDKKNKSMSVIIQVQPKEPAKGEKGITDKTVEESDVEMSMTKCVKPRITKREERKITEEKTKIFNGFADEMSITHPDKILKSNQSKIFSDDEEDFSFDSENQENQEPINLVMHHVDKNNTDVGKQLFNLEKSLGDLLNSDSFNLSNESEKLNLNESMDISKEEFHPGMFTGSEPTPTCSQNDLSKDGFEKGKEEKVLTETITGNKIHATIRENVETEVTYNAIGRNMMDMDIATSKDMDMEIEEEVTHQELKITRKSMESNSLEPDIEKDKDDVENEFLKGTPKKNDDFLAELEKVCVGDFTKTLRVENQENNEPQKERIGSIGVLEKSVRMNQEEVTAGGLTYCIDEPVKIGENEAEEVGKTLNFQNLTKVLDNGKNMEGNVTRYGEDDGGMDMSMTKVTKLDKTGFNEESEDVEDHINSQKELISPRAGTEKTRTIEDNVLQSSSLFIDHNARTNDEDEGRQKEQNEILVEPKELTFFKEKDMSLFGKAITEEVEQKEEMEKNKGQTTKYITDEPSCKINGISLEETSEEKTHLQKEQENTRTEQEESQLLDKKEQTLDKEEMGSEIHITEDQEVIKRDKNMLKESEINVENLVRGDCLKDDISEIDLKLTEEESRDLSLNKIVEDFSLYDIPKSTGTKRNLDELNRSLIERGDQMNTSQNVGWIDRDKKRKRDESILVDSQKDASRGEMWVEAEGEENGPVNQQFQTEEMGFIDLVKPSKEVLDTNKSTINEILASLADDKEAKDEEMEECLENGDLEEYSESGLNNLMEKDTDDIKMHLDVSEVEPNFNKSIDRSKSMDLTNQTKAEPLLADSKVIESLKDQSKETGCVWMLTELSYPKKKSTGLLAFTFELLESSATVAFSLKISDSSFGACSNVFKAEIHLDEEKQFKLPEYKPAIDFGFEKLQKYFEDEKKTATTIRYLPFFLDQMNLYVVKLNSYLKQIYSVLKWYPCSKLEDCKLNFRLFSFPILFSCNVSIDLTELFRLSKSSLCFEFHFGSFNENSIRSIFEDCLKRENLLYEFIVRSTRYIVDIEKEHGRVSKRDHIRFLPDDIRLA